MARGSGALCTIATGPNSIPVSPNWREKLLGRVAAPESTAQTHSCCLDQVWKGQWWQISGEEDTQGGSLCSAGTAAVLRVLVAGQRCEALVDTGASRSFINPDRVRKLQLKERLLAEECCFTVANGEKLRITRVVKRLVMWSGGMKLIGDFLVGPVPYDLVVGLDWLTEHKAAWSFLSDELRALVEGQWIKLTLVRLSKGRSERVSDPLVSPKSPAERAYDLLARQIAEMPQEEAMALLRPQPMKHKSHTLKGLKVDIKALLQQARENTAQIQHPMQGLSLILALPAGEVPETPNPTEAGQGTWCCALLGNPKVPDKAGETGELGEQEQLDDEQDSPWPTASMEDSRFDEWAKSATASSTPHAILEVLKEYRTVFPDQLPTGLPPKRPFDHRIFLVPGKLSSKSPISNDT